MTKFEVLYRLFKKLFAMEQELKTNDEVLKKATERRDACIADIAKLRTELVVLIEGPEGVSNEVGEAAEGQQGTRST